LAYSFRGFRPSLAGSFALRAVVRQNIMVGRAWWSKTHSWWPGSRKRGRGWGQDKNPKDMFPKSCSLQRGPTSYIFHHFSIVHSAMNISMDYSIIKARASLSSHLSNTATLRMKPSTHQSLEDTPYPSAIGSN
jgi:hypothetical protein